MKPCILFVDDNPVMRELVQSGLENDGFTVVTTENSEQFLEKLKTLAVDAILLDLMLADENGLDLIAQSRALTNAPIIIVSAKKEMVDKIVGLEMGADDYIAKPFDMKELASRIRAQIRRAGMPVRKEDASLTCGVWSLDRARLQIFDAAGKSGDLTVKEYQLLETLVSAPNRVLTREHLLDIGRQNDMSITERAIDTQIARIRKKIGDDVCEVRLIQSIRGIGYMFADTKA